MPPCPRGKGDVRLCSIALIFSAGCCLHANERGSTPTGESRVFGRGSGFKSLKNRTLVNPIRTRRRVKCSRTIEGLAMSDMRFVDPAGSVRNQAHNVPTEWNWVVAHPGNLELGAKSDIGAFTCSHRPIWNRDTGKRADRLALLDLLDFYNQPDGQPHHRQGNDQKRRTDRHSFDYHAGRDDWRRCYCRCAQLCSRGCTARHHGGRYPGINPSKNAHSHA